MAHVDFTREEFDEFCAEHSLADNDRLWDELHNVWSNGALEVLMQRANKMMDGFGVEALRQEGAYVDQYHGDIIATYVDLGDTYAATLLLDSDTGSFHLTSYGGWLEVWEAEHPREDVCVQCGEQWPVDDLTYTGNGDGGVCTNCDSHPPPVWSPTGPAGPGGKETPLIVMLRSMQGAPIAVHFWTDEGGANHDELELAFSVPMAHTMGGPVREEFSARQMGDPYTWTFSTLKARRSGPQVVTYLDGRELLIEKSQWDRLLVALDAFEETRWRSQPQKDFLVAPPVLWTCDELEIEWHGRSALRADEFRVIAIGTLGYGKQDEDGFFEHSWKDVIWEAEGQVLNELIEDGFVRWGIDDSVREHLHAHGICRSA